MAGGLALCGRDPKGRVLHGTEVMPCWEAAPSPSSTAAAPVPTAEGHLKIRSIGRWAPEDAGTRVPRTFVPVEEVGARATTADASQGQAVKNAARTPPDWGWTLFAEVEA